MKFNQTGNPYADDGLRELAMLLDGLVSSEKVRVAVERLMEQILNDLEAPIEELQSKIEDVNFDKESALEEAKMANERAASFDKRVEALRAEQEKETNRLNSVIDTLESANRQLIANTDAKELVIRRLEESNLQLHQKCTRLTRELREMAEKYEGGNNA